MSDVALGSGSDGTSFANRNRDLERPETVIAPVTRIVTPRVPEPVHF